MIQYQLIPVVGYTDLKLHFMKLDGDVTNVFLLGCGAMLDLELFFELNADDYAYERNDHNDDINDDLDENPLKNIALRRKIYVIDGHHHGIWITYLARPW